MNFVGMRSHLSILVFMPNDAKNLSLKNFQGAFLWPKKLGDALKLS